MGEKQLTLPDYLSRPWRRIDDYITILKDLLRYTAKAEQNTGKLEQAIEMMMELKKQADDLSTLDRITGYPGDLSLLGPIFRHVSASSFYPYRSVIRFLRASAMLKHVIDIGWTSVRPSVRLSHAGTVSKRLNIYSSFLHHTIAHSF